MKYILYIFLLLPFLSYGQNSAYTYKTGATNQTNFQKGGIGSDSLNLLPVISKTRGAAYNGNERKKGRIIVDEGDSTKLYYHDGNDWRLINGTVDSSNFVKYSDTARDGVIASKYYADSLYDATSGSHDNLVPYVGATQDVNLDTFGMAIKYVQFNTSDTVTNTDVVGRLHWDTDNGTLSIPLNNDVSLQIGQEHYLKVVNKTGVQINNGQVVYVNGVQGNRPTAALAQADSIVTSYIIGVATQDIADNAEGYITTQGTVRNVNTTSYVAGDKLYLSTTTAGALTKILPSSPNNVVLVGYALNSTVNGSIEVEPLSPMSADTNFTMNSDEIAVTQKAIKKYVNNQVSSITIDSANFVKYPDTLDKIATPTYVTTNALTYNYLPSSTKSYSEHYWFSGGNESIGDPTNTGYKFKVSGTGNYTGRFALGSITLGTKNPALTVTGSDLNTGNTTDISSASTILANSSGGNGSIGIGGATGLYAAIKGDIVSGAGNTIGSLKFYIRTATGNTNMLDAMTLYYTGKFWLGNPLSNVRLNTDLTTESSASFGAWGTYSVGNYAFAGSGFYYNGANLVAKYTQPTSFISFNAGDFIVQTSAAVTANTAITPVSRLTVVNSTGYVILSSVPEYADNAAAISGGLATGTIYRTGDNLKIVH